MSKKEFSADVAQLINLVTNSIYSNKEIFLRELLSNASDALAKAQFNARTDTKYLGDDHTLQITVDVDEEKKMITITDNGIGMTEQQVIEHIGTIAKSGTKAFVEKINTSKEENSSADLIGQFGIGFYSVFMVAQKVELETKSNEEEKATLRTSEGTGSYELSKSEKTSRGTTIRIYLKDENNEYANAFKVKSLIHKHSNYVPFPVMMLADKKEDETEENKTEYTQVNKTQSLWSKRKNEVTDEEYQEFYSSLSFDQAKPLDILHIHVE
jgi:molecular chaperone HtpG